MYTICAIIKDKKDDYSIFGTYLYFCNFVISVMWYRKNNIYILFYLLYLVLFSKYIKTKISLELVVYICHSVSLFISLSLSFSNSLYFSLSLSFSNSPSLSLYLSFCLSLSLSLCLSLSLSLNLIIYLFFSLLLHIYGRFSSLFFYFFFVSIINLSKSFVIANNMKTHIFQGHIRSYLKNQLYFHTFYVLV